jgi:hypothetical protein
MPNPKDYMDDDHTYVRGYVRRKRAEPPEISSYTYHDDTNPILRKLSWIIHIMLFIASITIPFTPLSVWILIIACISAPILLISLIIRFIKYKRNNQWQ